MDELAAPKALGRSKALRLDESSPDSEVIITIRPGGLRKSLAVAKTHPSAKPGYVLLDDKIRKALDQEPEQQEPILIADLVALGSELDDQSPEEAWEFVGGRPTPLDPSCPAPLGSIAYVLLDGLQRVQAALMAQKPIRAKLVRAENAFQMVAGGELWPLPAYGEAPAKTIRGSRDLYDLGRRVHALVGLGRKHVEAAIHLGLSTRDARRALECYEVWTELGFEPSDYGLPSTYADEAHSSIADSLEEMNVYDLTALPAFASALGLKPDAKSNQIAITLMRILLEENRSVFSGIHKVAKAVDPKAGPIFHGRALERAFIRHAELCRFHWITSLGISRSEGRHASEPLAAFRALAAEGLRAGILPGTVRELQDVVLNAEIPYHPGHPIETCISVTPARQRGLHRNWIEQGRPQDEEWWLKARRSHLWS